MPGSIRGTEIMSTMPSRSTWLLLALLTLGWGLNWPTMKAALAEVPVWTFRALCMTGGTVGIFLIARFNRLAVLPHRSQWRRLALSSVFNVTLWNLLIAYGLTRLPAGRSAILAYTMPLWVVLLSRMVLGELLTPRRVLGLSFGMAGMLLLLGDELAVLRVAPLGALSVLGAAVSWAIGTVLIKRYPTRLPTTAFTGWQMLLGGLPIVLGALVLDWNAWRPQSPVAVFALAYNILVASIVCYWAWFKIVSRVPAGVSALGTLMVPVVGVISSMVLLGERPSMQEYSAMLLVVAALGTVLPPVRRP
jgi:drug/metabolite transporter (DMT)-like permease